MAGTEDIKCITLEAGADLSALQFTAIGLGVDKLAASAVAATAPIVGILQNKPTAGQAAAVAVSGVAKAKAGGAWSSGDSLTATTGGVLIATTTNNHHIVGVALEDAATNDIAQVLVRPSQYGA